MNALLFLVLAASTLSAQAVVRAVQVNPVNVLRVEQQIQALDTRLACTSKTNPSPCDRRCSAAVTRASENDAESTR
jgi:hypothetical protein